MFKNRCWPTTFCTKAGDVDGWCYKWPVWLTPQLWYHPLASPNVIEWKVVGQHLFLNIIPNNLMVETGQFFWYDQGMTRDYPTAVNNRLDRVNAVSFLGKCSPPPPSLGSTHHSTKLATTIGVTEPHRNCCTTCICIHEKKVDKCHRFFFYNFGRFLTISYANIME